MNDPKPVFIVPRPIEPASGGWLQLVGGVLLVVLAVVGIPGFFVGFLCVGVVARLVGLSDGWQALFGLGGGLAGAVATYVASVLLVLSIRKARRA